MPCRGTQRLPEIQIFLSNFATKGADQAVLDVAETPEYAVARLGLCSFSLGWIAILFKVYPPYACNDVIVPPFVPRTDTPVLAVEAVIMVDRLDISAVYPIQLRAKPFPSVSGFSTSIHQGLVLRDTAHF